jgi:hypothetical protein
MQSEELLELTASEPLSMEEELEMQRKLLRPHSRQADEQANGILTRIVRPISRVKWDADKQN